MSFLAAAVGGGALIGAGASIYGANQQSNAAGQALDFQKQQYGDTQRNMAPYRQNGAGALDNLGRLNSGDMSKFYTSPDYNFRLNQGMNTLQNSAASRGGLLSGNAMRAISDYGQNTASGEYGNYWNRNFQQAQLGQSGALGQAQVGAGQAGQIGNTMMGQGQANASGAVGAANSINSGIGNYAFLNSYMNKNAPTSAYAPSGGGGVPMPPTPNPWA